MYDRLTFNKKLDVPVGWVWAMPSKRLAKRKIRALNFMGKEIVIFRDSAGQVGALDAFCPHMGAHLVDGKVEGDSVRCFFHNWKFDKQGQCVDIPCLEKLPNKKITTKSYIAKEQYGLIWLWTGAHQPHTAIPFVPALFKKEFAYSLGNRWQKKCHPNVVMINAIDEQHFQTVHKLPGHLLDMQPKIKDTHTIHFHNRGAASDQHWLGRLVNKIYKGPITYNLSYYCGTTGVVTAGPQFFRIHLMFTLREQSNGTTIGQTLAFTDKRKGFVGAIKSFIILQITKLAGLYFAYGDTKVFQKIRFDFKNPIKRDKAVIAFIKHLEQQPKASYFTTEPKPILEEEYG